VLTQTRNVAVVVFVCACLALVAVLPSVALAQFAYNPKVAPADAPYGPASTERRGGLITVLNESFEAGTVPPAGWNTVVTNPNYTWQLMSNDPHQGTFHASTLFNEDLVPQDEWLISPAYRLESGELDIWHFGSIFWCIDEDNCDPEVWLLSGDTPNPASDSLLYNLEDDWTDTFVWTNTVINLDPFLDGSPVRVGFRYVGNDGAEVSIDNLALRGTLAQPSLTITFDDFTEISTSYEEDQMRIESSVDMFISTTSLPDPPAMFPSTIASTFSLTPLVLGTFDLWSVDLRELSGSSGSQTLVFTGTREDGSTVQESITTDGDCCSAGNNFGVETFQLTKLNDLVSLEWPAAQVVHDNFEINLVPDPNVATMTFDGFNAIATSYEENQLRIESTQDMFVATSSLPSPPGMFPSNTAAVFTLTALPEGTFDLLKIDLNELNATLGPQTITFTGTREDNSTVQETITTDGACCEEGNNFGVETFEPTSLTELVSLEWPAELVVHDTIVTRLFPPDPMFEDRFEAP